MSRFRKSKHKTLIVILIITALGLGLGLMFLRPATAPEPAVPNQPSTTISHEVILEGEVICLPHRDTSGPQTLECVFGIQADDGSRYSLDANRLGTSTPPTYTTGERIKVTGFITPLEALSNDQMQKYDIEGIFSLTSQAEKISK